MLDVQTFRYNGGLGWYETRIQLHNATLNLNVVKGENEDFTALNQRIHTAVTWVDQQYDQILQFCVDQLLALKNQEWVNGSEERVTEQMFKLAMELEVLTLLEDGSLGIAFGAGELFWGHNIVVDIDPHYQLTAVDIIG
ncbi:MAG: DUF2262 domain-containing protein [Anaerolineae bacterium]|jgi:hypothetical protein|nr:DUF2262 domain-containing protein [Anaerolineae bacterium]